MKSSLDNKRRRRVREEGGHSQLPKKQPSSLRATASHYRQMFEKNRAVQLLIDPQTAAIVDANPAASEFYGYSPEMLQRMKITDINVLPSEQVAQEMALATSEQQSYFLFRHRLS